MRKRSGQLLGKSARFQNRQLTSEINADVRCGSPDNGETSRCGIRTSAFRSCIPVNADHIFVNATHMMYITFHQIPEATTKASNPRCASRSTKRRISPAICPAYNPNNLDIARFFSLNLRTGNCLKSTYACMFYLRVTGRLMCLSLSCLTLVLTLNLTRS